VVDAEVFFFYKARNKADTYMNYTRPPLAVGLEPIRKAFLDARNRGVHLRYLTEITKENLPYCKELMKTVHELRHLDGIKGNYMVSESEYIAPLILFEHGKIAPQALYSNLKEVVEQQQYVFDNFWSKAIPVGERIKEIEEGRKIHYETKVLRNQDEIADKITNLLEISNELLVCSSFGGLQLGYNKFLDSGNEVLARSRRGEHNGIRLITKTIDHDSIELLKTLLDMGIQIREIKNMPPINFSVTDKEVQATIDEMEDGKMVQSALVSNEPIYVHHFRSIFEELWKDGIDAKTRIASIEEGVDLGDIEVIPSSSRAREVYSDVVRNAQKEIMIMFPTPNAFLRQYTIGAVPLAKEAAEKRNVKVRILMPKHKSSEQLVQILTEKEKEEQQSPTVHSNIIRDNIVIRNIEQAVLDTHATILVVDRKISLVMEIRDDSKTNFEESIGLSTYSNSKAGVLSYLSLLENLWLKTELYEQIKDSNTRLELANEQLKVHDKMQQEFINIAAHELRTPIQPILGLSQILRTRSKDSNFTDPLDIVIRNATRLQRLTEDILDVQKIESQTLQLNKERIELGVWISNLVADYSNDLGKEEENEAIKLLVELNTSTPIVVDADRNRLARVIHNLLSNSIRATKEGTIAVIVKKVSQQQQQQGEEDKVIISVKDSGTGISSDILPRLFSKFVSKSFQGTGLGLYICKGIIEAHGGKIWAENNTDGKGATFSFSLPIYVEQTKA
jgi:signal transduction histidine kinase